MISAREILDLRTEWALDVGVIEKDYVLGWLLAAIGTHPDLAGSWVFKGGTCLRKCYYETYRFSEDLDFTVVDGGPETPEELVPIFIAVSEWLREEVGIEIVVDESSFRRRQNLRENPTTQARVAYRGPNPPSQLPKVKLDITADEVIVDQLARRAIGHQYSDAPRRPLAFSATPSWSSLVRSCARLPSVAAPATSMTSFTCIGTLIWLGRRRRSRPS